MANWATKTVETRADDSQRVVYTNFAAAALISELRSGSDRCAYRLPDLALVATIPVGEEPNWIVFSKDGSHAYVSNRKSDTLSVISIRDLKEIKRIPVGDYPQRMRVVDVPVRSVTAKP